MLKFFLGILVWIAAVEEAKRADMTVPLGLAVFSLLYVMPAVWRTVTANLARRREARDRERSRIQRENSEEFEHQTAIRRERERLQMLSEVRVNELLSTLSIQAGLDEQKMKMLAEARSELQERRKADIAALVERVEALKSEGAK